MTRPRPCQHCGLTQPDHLEDEAGQAVCPGAQLAGGMDTLTTYSPAVRRQRGKARQAGSSPCGDLLISTPLVVK